MAANPTAQLVSLTRFVSSNMLSLSSLTVDENSTLPKLLFAGIVRFFVRLCTRQNPTLKIRLSHDSRRHLVATAVVRTKPFRRSALGAALKFTAFTASMRAATTSRLASWREEDRKHATTSIDAADEERVIKLPELERSRPLPLTRYLQLPRPDHQPSTLPRSQSLPINKATKEAVKEAIQDPKVLSAAKSFKETPNVETQQALVQSAATSLRKYNLRSPIRIGAGILAVVVVVLGVFEGGDFDRTNAGLSTTALIVIIPGVCSLSAVSIDVVAPAVGGVSHPKHSITSIDTADEERAPGLPTIDAVVEWPAFVRCIEGRKRKWNANEHSRCQKRFPKEENNWTRKLRWNVRENPTSSPSSIPRTRSTKQHPSPEPELSLRE
ncbi:hypothetical protein PsorP6_000918 [Peronosclerospora sorghi]|uniref:Uncharacterized protein n=1 Tax=Peronosclerospora sorghi TaxID=230839 RepID=A0ACC0WWI6_9STRA|nr:hypothetical protein PsorP6_000918 [Peronosclerospora sorghi]